MQPPIVGSSGPLDLAWVAKFVAGEIAELDDGPYNPFDRADPSTALLYEELCSEVKGRGLWAPHLRAALGGAERTGTELVDLNVIFGASRSGQLIISEICDRNSSSNEAGLSVDDLHRA